MLIGLTGQIGAGKTTAAQILSKLGAHIIDADKIGREVVNNNAALRNRLAAKFGNEIIGKNGSLLRAKLAERAFLTEQTRSALDKIVHPALIRELKRQVRNALKQHETVVIDAALLLNWNLDREVDFVIVIHASLERRIKRLIKRGLVRADAIARNSRQLPYSIYQDRADRVILNSDTIPTLRRKLKTLFKQLTS